MNLQASLKKSLGVLAAFAVATSAAHATNIAQFSEAGSPVVPFTYTDNGAGSSIFTVTANLPVNFLFQVANGYDTDRGSAVGTLIAATLTFTGTATSGSGINLGGPGGLDIQPFTINSMVFKANTPEGGQTNLLTILNEPETGSGTDGGTSFSTSGNASNTFSSSFLVFANPSNDSASLGYTNLNELSGGLTFDFAHNVINSFTADAAGTFSATPTPHNTVPEPTSTAALAVGVLGLLALMLRARKTRQFNGAPA